MDHITYQILGRVRQQSRRIVFEGQSEWLDMERAVYYLGHIDKLYLAA